MEGTFSEVLGEQLKNLAKMTKKRGRKIGDVSDISIQRMSEEHEVSEELIRQELERLLG